MKKLYAWTAAIFAALLFAGCGGGSSPAAPANVTLVAHDSSALVTWTMEPGIEYWIWSGAGAVTFQTCVSTLSCTINRGAISPFLITGLVNG